jgi:hypothetical protein
VYEELPRKYHQIKHYLGDHNLLKMQTISQYEPSKYLITTKEGEEILFKFFKSLAVCKKAKEFRFCFAIP